MTEEEQIKQFGDELDAMINRARQEYDISYGAVVGALYFRIHALCDEAKRKHEKGEIDDGR